LNRYLLDTNVVSALSPAARVRHPQLAAWLREHAGALWLPAVALAEISAGVARLRRLGAARKAGLLETWRLSVLDAHAERVLALDAEAAHETGLLLDRAQASGLHPGFPDLAIAGIAKAHGLALLTRNLRHFLPLGIAAHDPFDSLP
jgi:predicted nucleic acid-binding protein